MVAVGRRHRAALVQVLGTEKGLAAASERRLHLHVLPDPAFFLHTAAASACQLLLIMAEARGSIAGAVRTPIHHAE